MKPHEFEEEVATFYRTHNRSVRARLITLTRGSMADAEELTQEAFLKVIKRWNDFRRWEPDLQVAALNTLVHDVAVERFRNSANRRAAETLAAARQPENLTMTIDPAVFDDQDVRTFFAILPSREQQVTVLRLQNLSTKQIAQEMGTASSTIRNYLARIRARADVAFDDAAKNRRPCRDLGDEVGAPPVAPKTGFDALGGAR